MVQSPNPIVFDVMHCGLKLDGFTMVTLDEVLKLLNMMSAKSSPMDFEKTSELKKSSGMFVPLIARLLNSSKLESLHS
jgi:hypothetical protein